MLPEPKLIYSPTKKLDVYLGGEFAGGSYRTDTQQRHPAAQAQWGAGRFYDYRAGVGVSYALNKSFTLDFGAGYSIQRHFAFHRAGENYRTDPSPFLRLEMKALF